MTEENLQLERPDFSQRYFELKSEGTTKAILKFKDKNSDDAEIIIDDNKWTMNKKGILNQIVNVENNQDNKEIAKIKFGLNKYYLDTMSDFQFFQFKNTNFWKDVWCWLDEKGNEIMEYIPNISMEKLGNIKIKNSLSSEIVPSDKFLNWIAVLGWYLLMINRNDCWTVSAIVDSGL